MTEEFLREAEQSGLLAHYASGGGGKDTRDNWLLTAEGEQWVAKTLSENRGKEYNRVARQFHTDLYTKSAKTTWLVAFWEERCKAGWDANLLRVIATRTFEGKQVKVTNWIDIKRYLGEKAAGIDTALIYAGMFEQRVMEELGC